MSISSADEVSLALKEACAKLSEVNSQLLAIDTSDDEFSVPCEKPDAVGLSNYDAVQALREDVVELENHLLMLAAPERKYFLRNAFAERRRAERHGDVGLENGIAGDHTKAFDLSKMRQDLEACEAEGNAVEAELESLKRELRMLQAETAQKEDEIRRLASCGLARPPQLVLPNESAASSGISSSPEQFLPGLPLGDVLGNGYVLRGPTKLGFEPVVSAHEEIARLLAQWVGDSCRERCRPIHVPFERVEDLSLPRASESASYRYGNMPVTLRPNNGSLAVSWRRNCSLPIDEFVATFEDIMLSSSLVVTGGSSSPRESHLVVTIGALEDQTHWTQMFLKNARHKR